MDKPDGIYGAEGDDWKYEIKNGVPVAAIRADGKRIAVSADDDNPAYGAILRQLVAGIIKPMPKADMAAAPEETESVTIRYVNGGEKKLTPKDPEWEAFKVFTKRPEPAPEPPPTPREAMSKAIDRAMISDGMEGPLLSRLSNERAKSDTLMADEAADKES